MIHLDHAATSFPKPAAVLAAMRRWFDEVGVSADRGDGERCLLARREVDATRGRVAALCGVPAHRVAFTSGATEALNLVLRALLRPGDTVLTTAFEHSSVVRPLVALRGERRLRLEVLPPAADGGLPVDAFAAALATHRPRLAVFTHASNVTGAGLDAAAFCDRARRAGCTTVLDASQTAGLLDLRVGADVVVASGHKALHGPPGIGFVAARDGLELPPQKQGGTGSSRALDEHPTTWPQAFEAGTPNTPAIFGLGAALAWVQQQSPAALLAQSLRHVDALATGLAARPGVRLLLPPRERRVPVLSLVHEHYDPSELGALFAAAGIQVRTGFHCAPWLHAHLGTERTGTVRLSPGPQLTAADLAAVLAAC
ncbi:MAG: aminotransferase class V-fold PLP-dependent enzyme [Planctomycetes bacterium]|nr:aminotransferase class V-fold PLP-dependent enzyme [Planctomycetota bacterium]